MTGQSIRIIPKTLALLFLFAVSVSATIIRVPQDQPTIQAGINIAVNGDTVLVAPGSYSVNLIFNGRNIVLKSAAGPEATILTPASNGTPIIRLLSGEDTTATINGFRFLGGNAPNGGGILFNNSRGTVINNIFDSCRATGGTSGNGGGVACIGAPSRARVSNNIFKNGLGGGGVGQADAIFCLGSTVEFSKNLVINNSSAAVIFYSTNSNVKTINNTIADNANSALTYQDGAVGDLRNNIFSNNPVGGMSNINPSTVTVEYNDFFSSPASGSPLGAGNISQNPLFVGGSPFSYNLQPTSPCIDAGDPGTPVPPNGGVRVDMGAFEFDQGPFLTLVSPADSSIEITQTPTFVWHFLADTLPNTSFSYRVLFDDAFTFTSPDSSPLLTDTSWTMVSPLSFGTTFYWKVRATDDSGQVVLSPDTRAFTIDSPPTTPADIYPDSGAVLDFDKYLVWLVASDPDSSDNLTYQLEIDDDPAFASPEISQSGITGDNPLNREGIKLGENMANSISVKLRDLSNYFLLQDDSAYFWRVRAIDNHGLASNFSDGKRSFVLHIVNSPPNPVTGGFSPAGNEIVNSNRPALGWSAATDPDFDDTAATLLYDIRLDTDGEIANNFRFEYFTSPGNVFFPIPDSLEENARWYWAVGTIDQKGGRSAFSATQSFRANGFNEAPGAFSLISPAIGSKLMSKTPALDWADAVDPDPGDSANYLVALASDSAFVFNFSSGQLFTSSYVVGTGMLSRGQQYFWKVRATDNNSAIRLSNEVFRFRVLQLGDINGDGILSPADIVLLLNHVFLGAAVDPPEVADLNCDGNKTPADVVLGLNAIFLGQPPPCGP